MFLIRQVEISAKMLKVKITGAEARKKRGKRNSFLVRLEVENFGIIVLKYSLSRY